MKFNHLFHIIVVCLCLGSVFSSVPLTAEENPDFSMEALEVKIKKLMADGDIPGLSLVIVQKDRPPVLKGFGYADLERKQPVTPESLFELASCSKAFTALAVLQLEKEGLIRLEAPVSLYLPWFYVTYKGRHCDITLRQLLHQTGGIPWNSIDVIPEDDGPPALEQTVRRLSGVQLNHIPGSRFEYATVNYDILGLIIEKVSGMEYRDYMRENIFNPLGLSNTFAGAVAEGENPLMARGYKIGFFKPRRYRAPVYRGNTPAAYIAASGRDMARWLEYQLGLTPNPLYPLMKESRQRDETVPPNPGNFSSYAMGWQVYVDGSSIVDHGGLNPNFTSYVGLNPGDGVGVAVLANSNSHYTAAIGRFALDYVLGRRKEIPHVAAGGLDNSFSILSIIAAVFLLAALAFLLSIGLDVLKGRRRFAGLSLSKAFRLLGMLILLIPFLLGVYLIPHAMSNVSWATAVVWSPVSFQAAVFLILTVLAAGYGCFVFSSLFTHRNRYVQSVPMVVILGLLSGGANAVVIFLITGALFSRVELLYQLYYFALAFFVYILGRKVMQTRLVRMSYDIVYDLRMGLIQKVFLTSYQRFEKMDRGRVYATMNDDTNEIGNAAPILAQIVTSIVTAVGAFIYMAAIAFWATLLTLGVVLVIAVVFSIVNQKARVSFERARDSMNVYMRLLNGLLDGFKELSLHVNKKREYSADIEKSCHEYRQQFGDSFVKFINAFLIGESQLIIVLGLVGYGIPRLFPEVSTFTLMSFIMVLLYLIGPITSILGAIPRWVRIRVSWNRIKGFEEEIPATLAPSHFEEKPARIETLEGIGAEGIEFEYEGESEDERFKVGPLDFEACKGEITFVIGGNGSGKTTLAKLLTGLYQPHSGRIGVEGAGVDNGRLGEYFSTVFSNYHLFEKLYDVDLKEKESQLHEYLKLLRLEDKVTITDGGFSTIELSGGQRKRLALLQCYLEDSPIYLFDEIAADQDPEFRKFFYRDLLLRMKEEGKIVIAITHDDHYFDVADRIVKMDMGKIEKVDASYRTT